MKIYYKNDSAVLFSQLNCPFLFDSQQQELLVMQPPVPNQPHEMVDPSSSRNVMARIT